MNKAQELATKYKTLLDSYKINTPTRLAAFFGQLQHESGLELKRENMNYSLDRLIEIFKFRLDTDKDKKLSDKEIEKAKSIAGQPRKIANFVYANREGNGDEKSDDGWKYRAGGYIGVTFKDNYQQITKDTGVDFITHPELLALLPYCVTSAGWFWDKKHLNKLADIDDVKSISHVVNGAYNGLDSRIALVSKCKTVIV